MWSPEEPDNREALIPTPNSSCEWLHDCLLNQYRDFYLFVEVERDNGWYTITLDQCGGEMWGKYRKRTNVVGRATFMIEWDNVHFLDNGDYVVGDEEAFKLFNSVEN
jgi:hypothetical protein